MLERIAAGRTDLIFEWLAQGGAANAGVEGASLIQWCAYYGDVSGIRFLRADGVPLVSLGDDLGLNAAAFHGHWRLCEFLLEQGADPNSALDGTHETPLHAALCCFESIEHEHVVRVLLAHGADPDRPTTDGVETGCFMRDCRTRGETPLHRAAAFGTPGAIALLLEAGAQIDRRDARGDSPLGWASWATRSTEVLRQLCFGQHRVREDRKTMRENLIGSPVAPR